MKTRPLYSDDKILSNILEDIEEGEYSIDGLYTLVYNLFEDIQCLKEIIKER